MTTPTTVMHSITKLSLPGFLSRRPWSVVHLDAEWDGHRKVVAETLPEVERQFEESVSFGYVDVDSEPEYAREIGILNVPTIAYYEGAKLVALVVGASQDVAENLRCLQNGERLKRANWLSRG